MMDLDQSVNQILRLDKRFLTDGNFDDCPVHFERKITRVLLERGGRRGGEERGGGGEGRGRRGGIGIGKEK
jgi:hypothetical protein